MLITFEVRQLYAVSRLYLHEEEFVGPKGTLSPVVVSIRPSMLMVF